MWRDSAAICKFKPPIHSLTTDWEWETWKWQVFWGAETHTHMHSLICSHITNMCIRKGKWTQQLRTEQKKNTHTSVSAYKNTERRCLKQENLKGNLSRMYHNTLPLYFLDKELTVQSFDPSGLQGLELICSSLPIVGKNCQSWGWLSVNSTWHLSRWEFQIWFTNEHKYPPTLRLWSVCVLTCPLLCLHLFPIKQNARFFFLNLLLREWLWDMVSDLRFSSLQYGSFFLVAEVHNRS